MIPPWTRSLTLRLAATSLLATALPGAVVCWRAVRRDQAAQLRSLLDHAAAIADIHARVAARLLAAKDDLGLIQQMESLVALPDVRGAFLLDPSGRVLAHPQAREWGRVYQDTLTRSGLLSRHRLSQPVPRDSGGSPDYDLAYPVETRGVRVGTLRLRLSTVRVDQEHEAFLDRAIGSLLAVTFLAGLAGLFWGHRLSTQARELSDRLLTQDAPLPQAAPGPREGDVLAELARAVETHLAGTAAGQARVQETIAGSREELRLLLDGIASASPDTLVVTDADNRILAAGPAAAALLASRKTDLRGQHLLEVVRDSQMLDLIRRALREPGTLLKEPLRLGQEGPRQVNALAVRDGAGGLLGMALVVSRG